MACQSKTVKGTRTPWAHSRSHAGLSNPFYTHFTQNGHFCKPPLRFNGQQVLVRWATEKHSLATKKTKLRLPKGQISKKVIVKHCIKLPLNCFTSSYPWTVMTTRIIIKNDHLLNRSDLPRNSYLWWTFSSWCCPEISSLLQWWNWSKILNSHSEKYESTNVSYAFVWALP